MKTINILRIVILIICAAGCKTEEKQGYVCNNGNCEISDNPQFTTYADCQAGCGSASTAGYNCNSGTCTSVTTGAQYSTLAACQAACAVSNGTVEISASWTSIYSNCNSAYTVVIGLGYTSTDVANEAYFAQSGGVSLPPTTYRNSSLPPGNYYYKAKKTYNYHCGTPQYIPPVVTKSGSFTITSGQTTTMFVGL